ncbi:MAG: HNH endonuclease signature motif containing protein [Candidatus Pacearchaeota archaeon]|jgi:hypothetical protein
MEKQNKCKICGWENKRTHLHHIIPLKNFGEDCDENLIELCPNHHAEASENEEEFAKKYLLNGKRMDDSKIADLKEAALIYAKSIHEPISQEERSLLNNISHKYGFDKYDYLAFVMGITRKSLLDTYGHNLS